MIRVFGANILLLADITILSVGRNRTRRDYLGGNTIIMSATPPRGEEPVSSEFLGRLAQDDTDAWLELLRRVYPSARAAIEQALKNPSATASKEAKRLVDEAYPNDRTGAMVRSKSPGSRFTAASSGRIG